ncbi:MAG TPA: DUF3352 domain-containing protein [Thermoleophilaceae bacterium]
MRRLLAIALCLVPLAAATGCGSSSSSDSGKSPLDNALGYLPKSAPLVIAIDTNTDGAQWKSLTTNIQKFPFSGQVASSLKSSISRSGLDYDTDVKPLLGNEFVLGFPTVQGTEASNSQFVGALQVGDKGKLESLLKNDKHVTKDGSSNGATLYRTDNTSEAAVDGDVFLIAANKQQLVAALEQRGRDDRLTETDFDNNTSGTPSDALIRSYTNVQELLASSPGTQTAQKVKWVAALRTEATSLSSQSDGLSIDFDAKTDPSGLTDAELPIAPGDTSPPVSTAAGEIGAGIRGLDQSWQFAESVASVVSPVSYARFVASKKKLSSRLGLDIDKDLIAQLSGNATTSVDIQGHYALRVEPKDPAALTKTLGKFARVAPNFAQGAGLGGAKLTRVRGLYRLTGKTGKTLYYGMVGKVFAASNDLPLLARIAADTPQPVQGAKGAVAIQADIGKIASELISRAGGGGLGGAFGGAFASAPLGQLTGWATSSTSGLSGHLQLQIK